MANSQDYAEIRSLLGIYEALMADAGDELMLLLSRKPDLTPIERAELLCLHRRLVQPKAELDHAFELYSRRVVRWPFTADMQLDATPSRIAAVM